MPAIMGPRALSFWLQPVARMSLEFRHMGSHKLEFHGFLATEDGSTHDKKNKEENDAHNLRFSTHADTSKCDICKISKLPSYVCRECKVADLGRRGSGDVAYVGCYP